MVGRSLLLARDFLPWVIFDSGSAGAVSASLEFYCTQAGVGRGVDLLFYLSHLFVLLLIVSLWRRLVTLSDSLTKLTRQIAIENAKKPGNRENNES